MKFKTILLTLLAAGLLGAQTGGPAPRAPRAFGQRNPQMEAKALDALRQHLNLSDAQVTQLQDLRTQSQTASAPLFEKLRANQVALHGILNSTEKPDAAKTGQLMIDSNALRTQLDTQRQDLSKKAAALLTPDQQTKLNTLVASAPAPRQPGQHAMPESWPMLHAAAQLGLTTPPQHGGPGGPGGPHGPMGFGFHGGPGAPPPPPTAQQ